MPERLLGRVVEHPAHLLRVSPRRSCCGCGAEHAGDGVRARGGVP